MLDWSAVVQTDWCMTSKHSKSDVKAYRAFFTVNATWRECNTLISYGKRTLNRACLMCKIQWGSFVSDEQLSFIIRLVFRFQVISNYGGDIMITQFHSLIWLKVNPFCNLTHNHFHISNSKLCEADDDIMWSNTINLLIHRHRPVHLIITAS